MEVTRPTRRRTPPARKKKHMNTKVKAVNAKKVNPFLRGVVLKAWSTHAIHETWRAGVRATGNEPPMEAYDSILDRCRQDVAAIIASCE